MSFNGFATRATAGRLLAKRLMTMAIEDPVVLALPRGGVPVAAEVAKALEAPIDLVMVRKIGVPWQPELAAAAVVDGGETEVILNEPVMRMAGLERKDLDEGVARELAEIARRRTRYLGGRTPIVVTGHTAIVVDDGIATGTTMRAALRAVRRRGPKRLVLAVPVAPPDAIATLRAEVDDVVCLEQPRNFGAIGVFYADFHQVPDDEVIGLLAGCMDGMP
ncbi:MAG: phosphoribosyltransferase [Alphaproteobacteria bacterium]|nr:phosphoribosyltransferase [Alphaproteobacteria bacterium]